MKGKAVVYALCDPLERQVCYIGSSTDVEKRYEAHLWGSGEAQHSPRGKWIAGLKAKGFEPTLRILEVLGSATAVKKEELANVEGEWVRRFLACGAPLLNNKRTKAGKLKQVTVGLTDEQIEYARKVGDGYVSRGVRRCIMQCGEGHMNAL